MRTRGVLATVTGDGRPQLSDVGYAYDDVEVWAGVGDRRPRQDPQPERDHRVTLHVTSRDFWTWVAVEGTAELTPVAAEPDDATVEELITHYRGVSGEHDDWDGYRAAMVADRRLVVRFHPEHAYGRLRA